jgi:uncharacterized protein (TIGR00156 family)
MMPMMRLLLLSLIVLGAVVSARAAFEGPGATPAVTRAAQVAGAPDDASCVLEGFIVEKLGSEMYRFRDDSGEVRAEIDDDLFKGTTVTPSTRVRLTGKVDRHRFKEPDVEVKSLEVL